MAYALEAFVMGSAAAGEVAKSSSSARVVPLAQALCLVPLSGAFRSQVENAHQSGIEFYFKDLPTVAAGTIEWAEQLSLVGPVVFVEAEFFGGVGNQASLGWQNGRIAFGPVHGRDAINRALQWLGVTAGDQVDEFDALQLGQYRHTEEWRTG